MGLYWTNHQRRQRLLRQLLLALSQPSRPPAGSVLAACQGIYPLLEVAEAGAEEEEAGVVDGDDNAPQEVMIYTTT